MLLLQGFLDEFNEFSCESWSKAIRNCPSALHFASAELKGDKAKCGMEEMLTKKIHPGRLTWNLQITHLERKMIFQTSMIMFHVNLQGCKNMTCILLYYVDIIVTRSLSLYIYIILMNVGCWEEGTLLIF